LSFRLKVFEVIFVATLFPTFRNIAWYKKNNLVLCHFGLSFDRMKANNRWCVPIYLITYSVEPNVRINKGNNKVGVLTRFPCFVLFGLWIDDLIVPKVLRSENRNGWGKPHALHNLPARQLHADPLKRVLFWFLLVLQTTDGVCQYI
jgi:hypothetical protein